jgi:hypothetical protein
MAARLIPRMLIWVWGEASGVPGAGEIVTGLEARAVAGRKAARTATQAATCVIAPVRSVRGTEQFLQPV